MKLFGSDTNQYGEAGYGAYATAGRLDLMSAVGPAIVSVADPDSLAKVAEAILSVIGDNATVARAVSTTSASSRIAVDMLTMGKIRIWATGNPDEGYSDEGPHGYMTITEAAELAALIGR